MQYYRIKKQKDLTRLFSKGKRAYSSALTVVYVPAERTSLAVCVGKKHGKSVKRNRIKRLLREAFRAVCKENAFHAPFAFALMPKEAESYSFATFKKAFFYAVKKAKLIEDKGDRK